MSDYYTTKVTIYRDDDLETPDTLYLTGLQNALEPNTRNSRDAWGRCPTILAHRPTIHIKTDQIVEINGVKDNLIISFQNSSQTSTVEPEYMKFNGIKGNLYYQAYGGYTLQEVRDVILNICKERETSGTKKD